MSGRQGLRTTKETVDTAVMQRKETSEKTPVCPESGEQLIGTTALPITHSLAQQTTAYRRLTDSSGSGAKSLTPTSTPSRVPSATAPRVPSATASRVSTPSSSFTRSRGSAGSAALARLSVSSQTPYYFAGEDQSCFGRCTTLCRGKKQLCFDIYTAPAKLVEWNEMVEKNVQHKPLPLKDNLDGYSDHQNKDIFGAAGTPSVFSNNCKERIQRHVKKLADLQVGTSSETQPRTSSGKGKQKRTSSSLNVGTYYDPNVMIFEDTIDDGYYIKAFTFIDNYATNNVIARDNQGHKAKLVTLGEGEDQIFALVNPDTSQHHRTTGDYRSSSHADL